MDDMVDKVRSLRRQDPKGDRPRQDRCRPPPSDQCHDVDREVAASQIPCEMFVLLAVALHPPSPKPGRMPKEVSRALHLPKPDQQGKQRPEE